ncbi:hypothetical protein, conserved [Babesia bigemina]|uniref:Uncharacterized protein n=1 Tax=Babesia bigemina TaxID=5866 RepID=A0A061BKL6_BABBI|nr:hypothetical protein, conserved [Babesia bigemina]CDR71977.1 hypothetical protein, conserved [Babesia bigemina]|eukprot:XP_012770918.1 hypothetical protein, conserved [Babesia bigemina]
MRRVSRSCGILGSVGVGGLGWGDTAVRVEGTGRGSGSVVVEGTGRGSGTRCSWLRGVGAAVVVLQLVEGLGAAVVEGIGRETGRWGGRTLEVIRVVSVIMDVERMKFVTAVPGVVKYVQMAGVAMAVGIISKNAKIAEIEITSAMRKGHVISVTKRHVNVDAVLRNVHVKKLPPLVFIP